eukprot:scaffold10241_cov127-Isochrysis_galbana.AAC.3
MPMLPMTLCFSISTRHDEKKSCDVRYPRPQGPQSPVPSGPQPPHPTPPRHACARRPRPARRSRTPGLRQA